MAGMKVVCFFQKQTARAARAARLNVNGKPALFPRNDRPYGWKCTVFQTENALYKDSPMRKFLLFAAFAALLSLPAAAGAASIHYLGNGKGGPAVRIAYSRSNGDKWDYRTMKPGQRFSIPRDATHLRIDNVPYNPKKNYKIKDGNVY